MSADQDVPLSLLFPPPHIETAQHVYDDEDQEDDDEHADTIRDNTLVSRENTVDGRRSTKQKRSTNTQSKSDDDMSSSCSDSSSSSSSEDAASPVKPKRAQRPRQSQKKQPIKKKTKRSEVDKSDSRVDRLISEALKSHRREQNRDLVNSLQSQLMTMLCSAVSATSTGSTNITDDDATNDDTTSGSMLSPEYLSCIRRAHKKDADEAKFNSSQHKSLIKSLLNNVTDIRDLSLVRIPQLDSEYGMDQLPVASGDTTLDKDTLQSSPNKTIPEAMYSALTDSYSACTLLKAFLNKLIPYITIPYIAKCK